MYVCMYVCAHVAYKMYVYKLLENIYAATAIFIWVSCVYKQLGIKWAWKCLINGTEFSI